MLFDDSGFESDSDAPDPETKQLVEQEAAKAAAATASGGSGGKSKPLVCAIGYHITSF